MNEDLTHLLNHPLNIITDTKYNFKKYTWWLKSNDELLQHRLAYAEYFHIHNYKNDDKYNVINISTPNYYVVYDVYKFLNYTY